MTSNLKVHFSYTQTYDTSLLAHEVVSAATGKVLTFYSYCSGTVENCQETSCQDLARKFHTCHVSFHIQCFIFLNRLIFAFL